MSLDNPDKGMSRRLFLQIGGAAAAGALSSVIPTSAKAKTIEVISESEIQQRVASIPNIVEKELSHPAHPMRAESSAVDAKTWSDAYQLILEKAAQSLFPKLPNNKSSYAPYEGRAQAEMVRFSGLEVVIRNKLSHDARAHAEARDTFQSHMQRLEMLTSEYSPNQVGAETVFRKQRRLRDALGVYIQKQAEITKLHSSRKGEEKQVEAVFIAALQKEQNESFEKIKQEALSIVAFNLSYKKKYDAAVNELSQFSAAFDFSPSEID
ncbi:hypothetical protein EBR66_05315 [bacterium]|nr:hypothetical protein [bacterium]